MDKHRLIGTWKKERKGKNSEIYTSMRNKDSVGNNAQNYSCDNILKMILVELN